MKTISTWAWVGQWLAALILASGIAVEAVTKADIGYIIISAGALFFALSTKMSRIKELKH